MVVNYHPRRSPMTRKVYTDEFKIAAAKLVREQG
jgi:transposase-like protein